MNLSLFHRMDQNTDGIVKKEEVESFLYRIADPSHTAESSEIRILDDHFENTSNNELNQVEFNALLSKYSVEAFYLQEEMQPYLENIRQFEERTNIQVILPHERDLIKAQFNLEFDIYPYTEPQRLLKSINERLQHIEKAYPQEILQALSRKQPLTLLYIEGYPEPNIGGFYNEEENIILSTVHGDSGPNHTDTHEFAHAISAQLEEKPLSTSGEFLRAFQTDIIAAIGYEGESIMDIFQAILPELTQSLDRQTLTTYDIGYRSDYQDDELANQYPIIQQRLTDNENQHFHPAEIQVMILSIFLILTPEPEGAKRGKFLVDLANRGFSAAELFAELLSYAADHNARQQHNTYQWLQNRLPSILQYFIDKGVIFPHDESQ